MLRHRFHNLFKGLDAVQNNSLFEPLRNGELSSKKSHLLFARSVACKVQSYLANGIDPNSRQLNRREVGFECVPRVNTHSLNGLRVRLRIMRVNVRNHIKREDSEK